MGCYRIEVRPVEKILDRSTTGKLLTKSSRNIFLIFNKFSAFYFGFAGFDRERENARPVETQILIFFWIFKINLLYQHATFYVASSTKVNVRGSLVLRALGSQFLGWPVPCLRYWPWDDCFDRERRSQIFPRVGLGDLPLDPLFRIFLLRFVGMSSSLIVYCVYVWHMLLVGYKFLWMMILIEVSWMLVRHLI